MSEALALEQNSNVVFAKCPKCKVDDFYVICSNCNEFTLFELKKDDDGQFAHCHCDCDCKISEMGCECGTVISSKFFYTDTSKERAIQANKQDIKREMVVAQISFKQHYFYCSGVLALIFWTVFYSFNDGGNPIVVGINLTFFSALGGFLVGWIPAFLTHFIHTNFLTGDTTEQKDLPVQEKVYEESLVRFKPLIRFVVYSASCVLPMWIGVSNSLGKNFTLFSLFACLVGAWWFLEKKLFIK